MTLRKAAEMALEVMEELQFINASFLKCDKAAKALRQALAQPEQEPVDIVTVEHARQIELAEAYERGWNAALAERKPVAWMYVNDDGECEQIEYGEPFDDPSVTPLYTAPPKHEWVELTDEEKRHIKSTYSETAVIDAVEAKLKEKNK